MIAVVVPEPAPWLGAVIDRLARLLAELSAGPDIGSGQAAQGPVGVRVLAPWAAAGDVPAWLPGRLRAFWQRRTLAVPGHADAQATRMPGWLLGEGALRAWAGARVDRTLAARFALRALVDRMAARWVAGLGAEVTTVVAPSCAAWRTFAAAAQRGMGTVLVEDLPGLRALHADLDAAARVHPQCAFLRRYRAGRSAIVRQEAEWVLAGHVMVRGRHARMRHASAGRDPGRIIDLDLAPDPDRAKPATARGTARPASSGQPHEANARVLLAGLAAARHGTMEALAAIDARPHLTLLVRAGEGLEPQSLLSHPRVAACTESERRHLQGVDVVIAPCWSEAYLPEVALAAARGIPIIATGRGAGPITPTIEIAPGDAGALGAALDRVLASARAGQPGAGAPMLTERA